MGLLNFAFDVKASDLLGRVGSLTVGRKQVETPCLFPVIHPVRQDISPGELKRMGFSGLMTNSLILYARRRDEAVRKGIHGLLDFEGVFMTDSGGYQVLEYGDVDVGYGEIARFQSEIGSELAVTLDRPTGFSTSRAYARETMRYSLKNALATIDEYGTSETVWLGPIQGGLFPDLLQGSAKGLLGAGFRFLALGSPTQVMENYRFADLVRMILASRRVVPYPVPLHLFGAGHPLTMAFSVALGCDTFDSASYVLFARSGRYMTERGIQRLDQMSYLPCSCPSCNSTGLRELREMESAERTRLLSLHNLYQLKTEVANCKQAIVEGRLWDLVEERAASHPRVMDAFRVMAENAELLEDGTPALKDRGLLLRGDLDELRPELRTSRARLYAAARRGKRKALVLLGDEPLTLTYSGQKRPSAKFGGHDLYRVHPCLGAYPAELDFVYPFTQTITVSTTSAVSETRKNARKALKRLGYRSVSFSAAALHQPSEERRRGHRPPRRVMAYSATTPATRPPRSRPRQKVRGPSPPSSSARSR